MLYLSVFPKKMGNELLKAMYFTTSLSNIEGWLDRATQRVAWYNFLSFSFQSD